MSAEFEAKLDQKEQTLEVNSSSDLCKDVYTFNVHIICMYVCMYVCRKRSRRLRLWRWNWKELAMISMSVGQ